SNLLENLKSKYNSSGGRYVYTFIVFQHGLRPFRSIIPIILEIPYISFVAANVMSISPFSFLTSSLNLCVMP
ncbi:hypothetical protein L9F63_007544, partial [Diploptera punctata]